LPRALEEVFGVKINDRKFCIFYSSLTYLMLSYESVGSVGMAFYRLLYLKV
jgi:hypothetical protein